MTQLGPTERYEIWGFLSNGAAYLVDDKYTDPNHAQHDANEANDEAQRLYRAKIYYPNAPKPATYRVVRATIIREVLS